MIAISISSFFYVVYGALAKYSMDEKQVELFDIVLARGLGCLILSTIIALFNGTSLKVGPGKRMFVALRSLFGTLAIFFVVAALKLIPVALTVVLTRLAPFWTILIGCVVLGLKLSTTEYVMLVISFAGTILIYLSATEEDEEGKASMYDAILGCTFAILTGISIGGVNVFSRKLSDLSFSVQLFYVGVVMSVSTSAIIYFDYKLRGTPIMTFSYSFDQYVLIACTAVSNFISISTATIAF